MPCLPRDDKHCTCTRLTGNCIDCGRDISISHGHNAPHLPAREGKLIAYRCGLCRSRRP